MPSACIASIVDRNATGRAHCSTARRRIASTSLGHPAGDRARVDRHPGAAAAAGRRRTRRTGPSACREGGRVIGPGERQRLADHPLAAEPADDRLGGAGGPGDDHLVRAVVDGDGQPVGPTSRQARSTRRGRRRRRPGAASAPGPSARGARRHAPARRAGPRAAGRPAARPPPPARGTRRCCGRRPRRAAGRAASATGARPIAPRAPR